MAKSESEGEKFLLGAYKHLIYFFDIFSTSVPPEKGLSVSVLR